MKINEARRLWWSDKETIIESSVRKICKSIGKSDYETRSSISEILEKELELCQVYKEYKSERKSKILWRIAFILWVPTQILITPILAIKWLAGYGWYLDSNSKLCHFIRRMQDNI